MAKRLQDDNDELEKLRSENRQLKSMVRSLQKALKRLNKGKDRLEDLESIVKDVIIEKDIKEVNNKVTKFNCPACNKGNLKSIDLGPRVIISCNQCKYRMVNKK